MTLLGLAVPGNKRDITISLQCLNLNRESCFDTGIEIITHENVDSPNPTAMGS